MPRYRFVFVEDGECVSIDAEMEGADTARQQAVTTIKERVQDHIVECRDPRSVVVTVTYSAP